MLGFGRYDDGTTQKLSKTAEGFTVLLDEEMVRELGLSAEAEVSVTAKDGVIEIRPQPRYASDRAFDRAADSVLKRRADLLKRLA